MRIENSIIQPREGVYLEEAESIELENVMVNSQRTNPVITIRNGRHITFEQFHFKRGAELLILLAGEKTEDIRLIGTDLSPAKTGFQYAEGASPKPLR